MLIIIVCSFTELLIEITEKLKSQQRTKRAKNLRKRARAAILFFLPINSIIRDDKIFRARYVYMQRRCRVRCVKDETYV